MQLNISTLYIIDVPKWKTLTNIATCTVPYLWKLLQGNHDVNIAPGRGKDEWAAGQAVQRTDIRHGGTRELDLVGYRLQQEAGGLCDGQFRPQFANRDSIQLGAGEQSA